MRLARLTRWNIVSIAPAGLALAALLVGACIATAPTGIERQTDQDAGGIDFDGPSYFPDAKTDLPVTDPHALIGADPSHGPFNGGQRVLIRGNGFASDVRVWFGNVEVDAATVVPIDPTRVQVNAPPGAAGPIDISAQNGDDESTRRTLAGGYAYDALYAVPSSGPVSGGTTIEIVGLGTEWNASTVALIDQKPCSSLIVNGPTQLTCTVPQGAPGAKVIAVQTGVDAILVLDGYTYEDSNNGFKGGLSGAPLAGQLKVLVYNNFSGDPIPDAHAIVGTNLATALVADADATGVATFSDVSLDSPKTVTVAARCHSPISFVDVPVDTVTVYLDPVLSPACASDGDPPPVGGHPSTLGTVTGEIVFDSGIEFKKGPWTVPEPANANERQAAYLFIASLDPTAAFMLPPAAAAITPDAEGSIGYSFAINTTAGNRAMYVLAGLEDRSVVPPRFTAYSMGIVKGVPVTPGGFLENVYIPMNSPLDHALTMDVNAPGPGPKGPDRLRASVAVMLGNDGFAILPAGQQSPLLPLDQELAFVGVPSLGGDLLGATYLSTARAATGPTGTAPMSVVGRILTTTTSQVVTVDGFVGVPTLVSPPLNGGWDGMNLETTFPAVGPPIDLSVYDIVSGNGLTRWTVAVPRGSHVIELPSLFGFELASLPPGPITIGVYGARIDGFSYNKLLYRDLRPSGMTAYSLDYFSAHL